jgi:hypothetical protein
MAGIPNTSSLLGGVSSISPSKGTTNIVYICGVPFEIPHAAKFIKRNSRGKYPRVLVVYKETTTFPTRVIAVVVSPRRRTWTELQEASRNGELTYDMLRAAGAHC